VPFVLAEKEIVVARSSAGFVLDTQRLLAREFLVAQVLRFALLNVQFEQCIHA